MHTEQKKKNAIFDRQYVFPYSGCRPVLAVYAISTHFLIIFWPSAGRLWMLSIYTRNCEFAIGSGDKVTLGEGLSALKVG